MENSKQNNQPEPLFSSYGMEETEITMNVEGWSLGDFPWVGVLLYMGKSHMASAPCDVNIDGTYDMSKLGSREISFIVHLSEKFFYIFLI